MINLLIGFVAGALTVRFLGWAVSRSYMLLLESECDKLDKLLKLKAELDHRGYGRPIEEKDH